MATIPAGMAAAWRRGARAWWSTVASTSTNGGDPVQPARHPDHRPQPEPALLVLDHSHSHDDDNCGASSTAASGTTLSMSMSNTTTYAPSTAASSSLPFAFITTGTTTGGGGVTDEEKATMREHIRDLIIHGSRGGCGAATATTGDGSSSSSSSALGRWLSELQVSWVLHLAQLDAASAGRTFVSRRLQHTARSWVLALHAITRCVASFAGWCSSQEEEEEALLWPPASEFVGFVAATLLLMLPFVDAVVTLDDIVISPASSSSGYHGGMVSSSSSSSSSSKGAVASAHKFRTLTDVRDALSEISEQVQLWHSCLSSRSSTDAEAPRISGEMRNLLLEKLDMVDEAMRNTRDRIRTHFMSLMTESHGRTASGLDTSPSIHVATQFAVSYIIVLSTSYSSSSNPSSVDSPAAYEEASLGEKNLSSSTNLNTVIIRSLEESLTRVSQSFPDHSLRFLFLANNFYFLWHQLLSQNLLLDVPMDALARKIDSYINSYLQVSWTPVLKPLYSYTSCCLFFMRHSAQRRFLAELERTYAMQKLWKVPDPELRKVLRTTIVDKVISAFTKFLEDGGVSASRVIVRPESLQEMLEELFEG